MLDKSPLSGLEEVPLYYYNCNSIGILGATVSTTCEKFKSQKMDGEMS